MPLDPNNTVKYELKGEITQLLKDLKAANVDTALLEKELSKVEAALNKVGSSSKSVNKTVSDGMKTSSNEVEKLTSRYASLVNKIQESKDKIKDMNNAIKVLSGDSGARKDIILLKAEEEQKLKNIRKELSEFQKELNGGSEKASIFNKSILKMGFLFTGAVGAGRGLVELLRTIFKESEFMQRANIAIQQFGKYMSSAVDYALKPFYKNLKSVRDLEIEKVLQKTKEASIENIASFEQLSMKIKILGENLNPTVEAQNKYKNAIDKIKKEYPGYLDYLSNEIKNHKDNNELLNKQSELLYNQIALEMSASESKELIKDKINAQIELNEKHKETEKTLKDLKFWMKDYSKALLDKERLEKEGTEISGYYATVINEVKNKSRELTSAQEDEENTKQNILKITEKILSVEKKYKDALLDINNQSIGMTEDEKKRLKELADTQKKANEEKLKSDKATIFTSMTLFEEMLRTELAAQQYHDGQIIDEKVGLNGHKSKLRQEDAAEEEQTIFELADARKAAYDKEVEYYTRYKNILFTSEKEFQEKILELKKQYQQEGFVVQEDAAEEAKEKTLSDYAEVFDNLASLKNAFVAGDIIDEENARDKKLKVLKQEFDAKKLSLEEYEKKKAGIELESEEKMRELKEQERDMQVVQAVSAGILATQKTFVGWGGWPWGVVPAGIMAALSAKNISNMKKLKFRDGGLAEGATHEQGGIPVKMGGRIAEIEHHEIINARPVYEHPVTRALANFNQTYHGKRRIPNARDVKSVNLEYRDGGRDTLTTGKQGLPSASRLFFRDGGLADTGGSSYTSSGTGGMSQIDLDRLFSRISFNISAESDISTEKLAYKVAVVQNKMKSGGLNLEKA